MTPSLLVVTIDRLPAWILPAYGATWVGMPALDALAGRGVVLDRVIATGDETQPLLRDLLGAEDGRPGVVQAAAREAVVVTDDRAIAASGLAGAATVRLVEAVAKADVEADAEDTNLARLFTAAAEAVAAGGHRLVWCHAGSLGVAWDAPAEFRDAYVDPEDPPPPAGAAVPDFAVAADTDPDRIMGIRQAFAGQLTLLDRCLGLLLDSLPAADAAGWTVLFAGVRGLPLGLHGRVGCGPLPPYGELVHVPALLVDARGRMAAQRYGGLVTPADLGATLAELMQGGSAPAAGGEPWRGRSLAGLFAAWSSTPRDRVIVATAGGGAIVTLAWHLVTGPDGPRLFHKPDDFFEVCDVANRCGAVAEELQAVLEAARAGDGQRGWLEPLSPEARGEP